MVKKAAYAEGSFVIGWTSRMKQMLVLGQSCQTW